jgi:hypothetical protein
MGISRVAVPHTAVPGFLVYQLVQSDSCSPAIASYLSLFHGLVLIAERGVGDSRQTVVFKLSKLGAGGGIVGSELRCVRLTMVGLELVGDNLRRLLLRLPFALQWMSVILKREMVSDC